MTLKRLGITGLNSYTKHLCTGPNINPVCLSVLILWHSIFLEPFK